MRFWSMGVALITHTTHVRNMRSENIYSKETSVHDVLSRNKKDTVMYTSVNPSFTI